MRHVKLTYDRLVAFYMEEADRQTAFRYASKMRNAVNPYIIVEKRMDHKYNVISGFSYVAAMKQLRRKSPFLCYVVGPFESETERKLSMLKHCVERNENINYVELLYYELIRKWKMNPRSIDHFLGKAFIEKRIQSLQLWLSGSRHNHSGIQTNYETRTCMLYINPSLSHRHRLSYYNQLLPSSYQKKAEQLAMKPFIQAIFLNNLYSFKEKCLLAEIFLSEGEGTEWNSSHLFLFKRYREKYPLFEDFYEAKKQVRQALNPQEPMEEYWSAIPHPKTLEEYLLDYEIYNLYSQMY
ncbi:hypothetical protein GWK91_10610 [Virgibacillus sp. MSP4-1]|uniref:hypothetical protein n=1 Tax=Virgibacillus sp. MSP4-1 TaxID=2700081 RepID=UPI00137BBD70|nr:hypothetical protein [Virgibacillus sp. MSP4-1]QHS23377.1 hypothetical protein GWK91_10610 [Virgibacillus sp. MSP4-1]